MKGLVLSGGKGTRLRPITHTSAKQLVPVANKPILYYVMENLAEAGIREVGVIVGDTAAEIEAACGDGAVWGLKLTYIHQEAPLGLAHAVKIAEDFIAGDAFVMYLGDNLLPSGITPLVQEFAERKPEAMILLTAVPDPERFFVPALQGVGECENISLTLFCRGIKLFRFFRIFFDLNLSAARRLESPGIGSEQHTKFSQSRGHSSPPALRIREAAFGNSLSP